MPAQTNSFGIAQEEPQLKVAHIAIDKDCLRIVELKTISFKESEVALPAETPLEDALQGLDFDFEFGESPADKEQEKKDSIESYGVMEKEEESEEHLIVEDKMSLEELALEMNFEHGTLSLNLDINNVIYKPMELPQRIRTAKIYKEIKKQFYDDDVPGVMTLSYLKKNDGSYVGISHEKNMELLERIIMLNRATSKKRFHYSYIQTNEIVLLNALRFNYSIKADDISAIINIGKENTQVLLTRGYDYLIDLPVISEGYESRDIIKTVISRIMLERTHSKVQHINNYFLAGDGLQDSMIDFIKNRDPDCFVSYLLPVRLCEQSDYSDKYDEKTLAAYIIPIMLSVTAALPKEPSLIRTNFLPKQLKEQQNFFSISTESFLVLGILLISILVSIHFAFQQQTANRGVVMENSRITSQTRVEQTKLDSLFAIERQIADIEKNISRTNLLLADKNQWHFIIDEISKSFRVDPLSWLTSMKNDRDKFMITGKTNNRLNIVELSRLFPDAVITHITEEEIQDKTVWSFEIVFKNPDPLETKRLNYQRESEGR